MKRLLTLVTCVYLILSLAACGQNGAKSNYTPGSSNSRLTLNSNESNLNKVETGNESNREGKKSNNSIFSPESYVLLSELEGKQFDEKKQSVSKKEFLEMIKNPISYAKISYTDGYGGLICTEPRVLLKYVLPQLEDYESDFDNIEIKYNDLPQSLSSKLRFTGVEDNVRSLFISRGILMDDEKNMLISYKNENDIQTIIKAAEFKTEFPLKNLNVICGYIQNGTLKTVLAENDTIYTIENDTLELVGTKKTENWETVSGYPYDENSENKEKNRLFLYQVNNKENKVRKIDIFNDKVVFESTLDKFPAKGEIIKIEHEELDGSYVLDKEQGKYKIYFINESQLNNFKEKESFSDGTPFGIIEDIWSYNDGQKGYIVIFQKDSDYPIKMMEASDMY